eukprot:gene12915-9238_t
MFFKENGDEGWKIIFEDFNLLLSCLRLQLSSRDTLLHQVKCSLSSKDVTVRNFSLRIIANHLGRCLADSEVNVSEIWHTLRPILELAVESLQSRWIPSPGTTHIYHLVHVFSTTKAKELQEAAMTQGFYLKDDIDLCGTVLGLVLSLRARMTSHEANIYLSLQRPLVVEPPQSEWFDQEELIVQKTSRLWTMLVRSVLSDCPKRPSDSIAMHTGILLCAWGSLLAIEKVMTLKYAQLYLGSGSLASLATTRDDFGSVLPMAEELYQNSVSRSLVDSSTTTERTTDDIWSTGLVRGYDVPVEAAVRQFEHSVRAFQHARTTAQTLLLSTAQVTDFGEALEVGASAEVKLQRALLNLMVQLSGRDTIAWKIAIPFLLESCLLQWQRQTRRIDEQVEALDAYLQIQLLSRLHQDDTAAEDCFMMMPEVSLDRCRLRMDDKVAESLWLELLRRVAFEWKSYGSVLQAMATTPPSATIPTATAVPRPRSTVAVAAKRDSPSLESLEEVHTASKKVSLLMEMFGLLCGKLFVDSGPWRTGAPASAPDDDPRSTRKTMSPRLAVASKRERVQGREKTRGTLWDSMPWKCKLPMMTLTTTVLRQLSHEVKRAMKMVPALLVHDRAHPSNDTHRHRLLTIRWPPPMTAAAGPMGSGGVSSCDDDDGGEDEEGDEGDDDSSHANLFPILMTLAMGNEGDQEAMNMLLLLKHFLLREQFYLQQQVQETAMERNVDVAPRDRATAGDHSDDESSDVDDHDRHDRHEASTGHRSSSAVRSPAPSVARLL